MILEIPDLLGINGLIKGKYTRDGIGVSPEINWSDAPANTKSFALFVHDPDALIGDFIHWIIINIPSNVNTIPREGVIGEEIINSAGRKSYVTPAPPAGMHRYYFTIYALSAGKLENVTKDNFHEKINSVKLAEATIIGKYSGQ